VTNDRIGWSQPKERGIYAASLQPSEHLPEFSVAHFHPNVKRRKRRAPAAVRVEADGAAFVDESPADGVRFLAVTAVLSPFG